MNKTIMVAFVFLCFGSLMIFGQVVGNPFSLPSTAPSAPSAQSSPSAKVEQKAPTNVVAEKVEYLTVPPELEGAIVHGDYDNWKLSKTVGKDGKTDVLLKKGWLYLLEKDGVYYYPNGDKCIAWWSYAIYLGDHKWQNTYDLSRKDQQPQEAKDFKPYEVFWPENKK